MRVIYARLQTPIFVPGVGNLKDTLTEIKGASGTLKSLSMSVKDGVLELLLNDKVNFAVPLPNVQGYVFVKDEPVVVKK